MLEVWLEDSDRFVGELLEVFVQIARYAKETHRTLQNLLGEERRSSVRERALNALRLHLRCFGWPSWIRQQRR